MNILFFLTPKEEVAHIYEDDNLRGGVGLHVEPALKNMGGAEGTTRGGRPSRWPDSKFRRPSKCTYFFPGKYFHSVEFLDEPLFFFYDTDESKVPRSRIGVYLKFVARGIHSAYES